MKSYEGITECVYICTKYQQVEPILHFDWILFLCSRNLS